MKYTGPRCRLCRREGVKLFLKGDKCETQKCPVTKRGTKPGDHGQSFIKMTEYGRQLREKQKAKRIYGVQESQFVKYYKMATRQSGASSDTLMQYLERRLDNLVYKAGFAASRSQARQMVGHGLFTLNGQKVTIPSIIIKEGDSIGLSNAGKKSSYFSQGLKGKDVSPRWLEADMKNVTATVKALPEGDDLEQGVNSRLIIEFYSR